jgi:hypothetical protein
MLFLVPNKVGLNPPFLPAFGLISCLTYGIAVYSSELPVGPLIPIDRGVWDIHNRWHNVRLHLLPLLIISAEDVCDFLEHLLAAIFIRQS